MVRVTSTANEVPMYMYIHCRCLLPGYQKVDTVLAGMEIGIVGQESSVRSVSHSLMLSSGIWNRTSPGSIPWRGGHDGVTLVPTNHA